ncbi:protein kinase [bacterium]|nr:protein kinase [bacterium]
MEPITTFLTATIAGNLVMGILGNAMYDLKKNAIANFWNDLNLGNHDLQNALDQAYTNTFASLELVLTNREGLKRIIHKIVPTKKSHQELAQDFTHKVLEPFLLAHHLSEKQKTDFCRAAKKCCEFLQQQQSRIVNYDELFGELQKEQTSNGTPTLMNAEARQTFGLIESILFVGQDLADVPDLAASRAQTTTAFLQRFQRVGGQEIKKLFNGCQLPEKLFYVFLQQDDLFLNGLVYYLDLAIKNNQKVANIIQEYRAQEEKKDREREKQARTQEHQELIEKIGKMEQALALMKDTGVDTSPMTSQLHDLQQQRDRIDTLIKKVDMWTVLQQKMRAEIKAFDGYFHDILGLLEELGGKLDDVLTEVRTLDRGVREVVSTTRETKDIALKTSEAVTGLDSKVDFILDLLQGFRQDTVLSDHLRESLVAGLEPAECFDIHNLYDFQETRDFELGRGAVGVVYRAVHKGTGEECALKLLKHEYRNNTTIVARFLREGTVLRGIQHPNIVRVDEVGGGGKSLDFYIHMELLKGASLRRQIDEKSVPRAWQQLQTITTQLYDGLELIHANGIIHRDLNPNNIILTKDGQVKIMDFGVAKIVGLAGLTLQGEVVGTSKYMSPEQERGEAVDLRSDIYSLGLVLYELYTFRKPDKPPKSIRFYNPQLPEWLDTIMLRCLDPDKEKRFASMAKLIRCFEGQGADPEDLNRYKNSVLVFLEDGRLSRKEEKVLTELRDELALPEAICRHIEQEAREIVANETVEEAEQALQKGDLELVEELYTVVLRLAPDRADILRQLESLHKVTKADQQVKTVPTGPEPSQPKPVSNLKVAVPQTRPVNPPPDPATIAAWTDWSEKMRLGTTIGHTAPVNSVFITNDNTTVISSGNDRIIRFWELETGREQKTLLPGIGGTMIYPSLSQQKNSIVTTNGSHVGLVLDAQTGQVLHKLTGHEGIITSLDLSSDETLIATGSIDKTIRLWEAETGSNITVFNQHEGNVNSVSFSRDTHYIVSASHDKTARIFERETTREFRKFTAEWLVITACLSPDNKLLLASSGLFIYIWDIESSQLLEKLRVTDIGGAQVQILSVSANNEFLILGCTDKIIRIREMGTWRELHSYQGHTSYIKSVYLSPDNKHIASGSADDSVRVWEVDTEREKWSREGHTGPVNAVCLSPDQALLASGSDDCTARVWSLETHKETHQFLGHNGAVKKLAFSSDGMYLASAGLDCIIFIWDLAAREKRARLSSIGFLIHSLAFTHDDSSVVAAVAPASIKVWDWRTGSQIRTFECGSNHIRTAALSESNDLIVTGGVDHKVYCWNFQTGKLMQTFSGHTSPITALAISSDSRLIVSADSNAALMAWEAQTGNTIARLQGHRLQINSVLITPDNRSVISASQDKTINIWDIESATLVKTLSDHTGNVWSLALSPDAHLLASASADKTIRLWQPKA